MSTITITLNISEIIYDIQNKTYLTGRSAADGSNHAHIANMQANDDDENAAQILRSVTNAYAVLRNRFAEYSDTSENNGDNKSLETEDDLLLTLNMPSNFNGNVVKTISESAHQFIVATAIADWFAITAKGETTDYSIVAGKALAVLEEALSKRTRPKRIR